MNEKIIGLIVVVSLNFAGLVLLIGIWSVGSIEEYLFVKIAATLMTLSAFLVFNYESLVELKSNA